MHRWRRERHVVAAVVAILLVALAVSAASAGAGTTRKPVGTPPEILNNPGGFVGGNGNLTNARNVTWTSINSGNVASLEPAWTFPLKAPGIYGMMSSNPIVSKGVVYFSDSQSNLYAINTNDGSLKWENRYSHVGLGQNGVSLANGRLLAGVDTDVLSLDAKTGKEMWRTTLNADDDAAVDMAPLAWKNLIIVSTIPFNITRGIYQGGQKGVVFGLNAKTGKKVWSFDTTTNNLWGNPEVNSGGGLWSTPSIDNKGTMYMSVANPGPIMGTAEFPNGSSRPGKNLYTNSLVALNAKTGKLKWYYQAVPHDIRDFDLQLPPILATFKIKGKSRDVVITGGKMGYVFVLDRNTGKLIWKRKVGKHNEWGDPSKPFPTKEEDLPVTMYPGIAGGVETPMAVKGSTIYVPVANLCAMVVYPRDLVSCPFMSGTGAILALDGATGAMKWKTPLPTMPDAAVTVVDDVLMTPGVDGTLFALSAKTGKILTSPMASAGVNAPPAVTGKTMYIGAGVTTGPGQRTAFTAWRLP
ncbi:MAG: PQQ-binding-like beta-propeller repeat protein [Solirubrobacterales bacterium]